ncbi:MAG: FAD-dependent oxidoreductase [Desulfuromonadales bacterium]
MATFDFDIGVIGGGAAGLTVTAGAAQLGAKTLLIEKDKALGGDCLHYGCVPSKTLIKSAHVYHQMKTLDRFGLPLVDLPPVDFRQIAERIKSVIDTIQQHDSEQRFCKLGAKVVFGEPHFIDEHSLRLNGQTFAAKNWVIATGSSAVVPPIPGLAETPHLSNRDIFDYFGRGADRGRNGTSVQAPRHTGDDRRPCESDPGKRRPGHGRRGQRRDGC